MCRGQSPHPQSIAHHPALEGDDGLSADHKQEQQGPAKVSWMAGRRSRRGGRQPWRSPWHAVSLERGPERPHRQWRAGNREE